MLLALALVCVPLAFGVAAFLTPSDRVRPWLVPAGGCVHFVLFLCAAHATEESASTQLRTAHGTIVCSKCPRRFNNFFRPPTVWCKWPRIGD